MRRIILIILLSLVFVGCINLNDLTFGVNVDDYVDDYDIGGHVENIHGHVEDINEFVDDSINVSTVNDSMINGSDVDDSLINGSDVNDSNNTINIEVDSNLSISDFITNSSSKYYASYEIVIIEDGEVYDSTETWYVYDNMTRIDIMVELDDGDYLAWGYVLSDQSYICFNVNEDCYLSDEPVKLSGIELSHSSIISNVNGMLFIGNETISSINSSCFSNGDYEICFQEDGIITRLNIIESDRYYSGFDTTVNDLI